MHGDLQRAIGALRHFAPKRDQEAVRVARFGLVVELPAGEPHSVASFAALTTLSQRAQSSRITAERRSGGWSQISRPLFASRSARPGVAIACAAAFRNLDNTSRSEEHTSELQSQSNLVCRLLLE